KRIEEAQLKIIREALHICYKKDSKLVTEYAIDIGNGIKANLVAVNGRTAVQIRNQALNEALGQLGTTIVKLRAVEGPWDENWHIAGSWPTNIAVNILNANNSTTVIVAGIHF
ncbi:10994_t:CDS:2, partial [Racocetra fulgida]